MSQEISACSEHDVLLARMPGSSHTVIDRDNPEVVDSLLHPLAILIRQALTRSGRVEHHLILIDDEENILQALDAGVEIHSVYYSDRDKLSSELARKLPPTVIIHEVAKRTCKKLFENDKTSRVFALACPPAPPGLERLLQIPQDIVALEDLTISGNIGAIVRTCVAFGAGAIVLLNAAPVDIYDRRLIRASRGYVFSLPVLTATREEFIRFCKQNDISMLVMTAQADHPVQEATSLAKRLAIVFGSEKGGCSQTIMEAASLQVQIPTDSKVESLNVSTAAAVTLYSRAWFNTPKVRK